MPTSITIGTKVASGTNANNLYRQGVEITSPAYLRGAQFPKLLPNASPGLIRSGSLLATFEVRHYDDTLNEPSVRSLDSLSMDSPKAFTKIRLQQERRDLGQLGESDSDVDAAGLQPFREASRFYAKTYIELGDARYPMSAAIRNAYFGSPYRHDGVIEPLTIRSVADFSSIEVPKPAHGVFGSLESSAAEDVLGRAAPIVFSIEFGGPTVPPFFDAGQVAPGPSTMPDPGFVESTGSAVSAFTDSSDKRSNADRYNDPDIRALMLANVTGSISDFPAPGTVIAQAGSVVRPTQLQQDVIVATDSIAFIGLRR